MRFKILIVLLFICFLIKPSYLVKADNDCLLPFVFDKSKICAEYSDNIMDDSTFKDWLSDSYLSYLYEITYIDKEGFLVYEQGYITGERERQPFYSDNKCAVYLFLDAVAMTRAYYNKSRANFDIIKYFIFQANDTWLALIHKDGYDDKIIELDESFDTRMNAVRFSWFANCIYRNIKKI